MQTNSVSSAFLTADQYQQQQMQALTQEDELGRDAFLTLLTTQLTNQNPLDPMDNEAFVAQLAQFSSVEGIKGMQSSLEKMVSGMHRDQMLAGANLVGKSVATEGGTLIGGDGQLSLATIDLPSGAQSVIFSVHNLATGELVYRQTEGAQPPGQLQLSWNGVDNQGDAVPLGHYGLTATAVRSGQLEAATVTTENPVRAVTWDPETEELTLEIANGEFITLAEVKRISG